MLHPLPVPIYLCLSFINPPLVYFGLYGEILSFLLQPLIETLPPDFSLKLEVYDKQVLITYFNIIYKNRLSNINRVDFPKIGYIYLINS